MWNQPHLSKLHQLPMILSLHLPGLDIQIRE